MSAGLAAWCSIVNPQPFPAPRNYEIRHKTTSTLGKCRGYGIDLYRYYAKGKGPKGTGEMAGRLGSLGRASAALMLVIAMVGGLAAVDVAPSAADPPGPGSLDPAYGTNGLTTVSVPGG